MKMFSLLFILFISLCSYACEEVNLYESHPVINQLPIQNQGTLNTCYAQTLSTIYNLEPSQNKSTMIDPFWIAFVHKIDGLHWQPRKLDYSMMSLAYGDLQKTGTCDLTLISEAYEKLKNGVNYSDSQLFYLLTQFFGAKNNSLNGTIDTLVKELPEKTKNDYEVAWTKADLQRILLPIADSTHKRSLFNWLKENVFDSCRANLTQSFPDGLSYTARQKESNEYLAAITENLLRQQKPIAIGFCAKVFTDPDLRIKVTPRFIKALNTRCGAHYVTLVGSRKRATTCEYLVRNNLGTGFWAHKDYTCYCRDQALNQNRDCHKSELSNPDLKVLGCWIKRDTLLTNTFDLSYLNTF